MPLPIITTGKSLSWDEWVRAVEQLEARAELAERNGLRHTAQSWRNTITNLHPQVRFEQPPLCEGCGVNRAIRRRDGAPAVRLMRNIRCDLKSFAARSAV
jgi:hypothetical protein